MQFTPEELLDKITAYVDSIMPDKKGFGFLFVVASESKEIYGVEFHQRTNMSKLLPDYYISALGLKVAVGVAGPVKPEEPSKDTIQ